MSVASKNLFELLGNDDGDSDSPSAPVKTVDKTSTHTAKRNTDGNAPARGGPVAASRRGGALSGNEAAFRDRNAGSDRNRGKSTEEGQRGGPRGGYNARVRGGRGGRHPRDRDDRHSKGLPAGSEKQAAQSSATEGQAELKDEQAGEEIAQKDAAVDGAAEAAEDAEPEEKHTSYADYVVQQAEKKLALEFDSSLNIRKANEGSKEAKKWAGTKELVKEDDEDYFAASGGKTKRERERKTKQVVEIDNRFVEPERPRGGARGGRGGARGDSGRGGGRGRGAPRGDFRGGRGGGRGEAKPLNTNDKDAFPSLGGGN